MLGGARNVGFSPVGSRIMGALEVGANVVGWVVGPPVVGANVGANVVGRTPDGPMEEVVDTVVLNGPPVVGVNVSVTVGDTVVAGGWAGSS